MTFTLVLAGSEVRRVHCEGTRVCIEFSAACVQQHDGQHDTLTPSAISRPIEGYLKPLLLELHDATWCTPDGDTTLADCFGAVADGSLRVNGQAINTIALPLVLDGPIDWSLSMRARSTWHGTAQHVSCQVDHDARFIESMAC
jgi:hypothetical protein